jgi:hypothetical protein
MTGNTLREAIEAIEYPKPTGTNIAPEFMITVGKIIEGEVIDAILDAIIREISENQKGQFEDEAGYTCWYLDDLTSLLEQAKSK